MRVISALNFVFISYSQMSARPQTASGILSFFPAWVPSCRILSIQWCLQKSPTPLEIFLKLQNLSNVSSVFYTLSTYPVINSLFPLSPEWLRRFQKDVIYSLVPVAFWSLQISINTYPLLAEDGAGTIILTGYQFENILVTLRRLTVYPTDGCSKLQTYDARRSTVGRIKPS